MIHVLSGPPIKTGGADSVVIVDNWNAIRDFLASRRARITPQQAGLPAYGGNRRVPGLRREEVALSAGVSVDYYTRLKRGTSTACRRVCSKRWRMRSTRRSGAGPPFRSRPALPIGPRVLVVQRNSEYGRVCTGFSMRPGTRRRTDQGPAPGSRGWQSSPWPEQQRASGVTIRSRDQTSQKSPGQPASPRTIRSRQHALPRHPGAWRRDGQCERAL